MYRLQLRIQFKILTRYSKFKALVSTMPWLILNIGYKSKKVAWWFMWWWWNVQ
jgi:hypothetical protein